MDERESSQAIEAAAAEWVARLERAPLDATGDRQFQHWLRGDARRRGAFVRARALWLRPDIALAAAERIEHAAEPHSAEAVPSSLPASCKAAPIRRAPQRLRQWMGALAASLLLAVFVFVSVPTPTAYATAKGEMRRIPLADGSTITLNTDSRVDVYERDRHLLMKVRRGEVFVETRDGEPLQVEVDGRRIEASATAFVVRKLDGRPAQVVMEQADDAPPHAHPGKRMQRSPALASPRAWPRGMSIVSLPADQMHRELAWREGKLAFHGETLADAAAEFARYNETSIVIADPALAKASITGLFAANNPAGFSRAVADVFGARVHQDTEKRIVITAAD